MATRKLTTKEILHKNLSRSAPESIKTLKILLHNVRSMHNVGAAFRCADAFGIAGILISGFTPAPPRPEISKTAIGAEKHVEWEKLSHPGKGLKQLKEHNFELIGIEQTQESIHLPDYHPPGDKKFCLIFGNEVTGIDEEIMPYIDTFTDIPQYGHKHSLNVSVTVGIAVYGFLQKFW